MYLATFKVIALIAFKILSVRCTNFLSNLMQVMACEAGDLEMVGWKTQMDDQTRLKINKCRCHWRDERVTRCMSLCREVHRNSMVSANSIST